MVLLANSATGRVPNLFVFGSISLYFFGLEGDASRKKIIPGAGLKIFTANVLKDNREYKLPAKTFP